MVALPAPGGHPHPAWEAGGQGQVWGQEARGRAPLRPPPAQSPVGGRGDAVHPQPGPGSCTAISVSLQPRRRGRAQHTAVFAPVGHVKHAVCPPALRGLRRLRVPRANHLHAKASKLSTAFPKTQGWRGWEEAVITL